MTTSTTASPWSTFLGCRKPAADSWGLNHLAYSYNSLRDLLSTYVRLRDQGIVPFRPINHGPTVSMYYHDPDGTGIELQVDTFPTKQEAQEWFGREAFKENPIGVLFDPEKLLADFEAGVPEEELLTRPARSGRAEPRHARLTVQPSSGGRLSFHGFAASSCPPGGTRSLRRRRAPRIARRPAGLRRSNGAARSSRDCRSS